MDKILITQGGQFKSVTDGAGIRDSWDFVEAIQNSGGDGNLYAKVSAVYRAANLTADAVSNIPFAVMKGEEDIDTSAEWTNVIGIMPNPRELLRLWTLSLFFHNAAYGRISKTNAVKRRLFYVMPENVKIITDPTTGEVKELERKANDMVVNRYSPTDYKNFVYLWHLDHTTELLPSKNTDFLAMSQAAGIIYSADFWTQNYFKNGAVKPTIVSVKGMVSNDKRDELESRFARFVRSIGTRFSELAKVINGDAMEIKSFGDGLGEIKDSPVYKQAIENIAMASGMPLSLLLANSANYATAQVEYANWFRDKITPKAFEIQEWLNDQMFQPAGYYFEFRPEQSEPSQQEEVERANAYSTYTSAGMLPSIAAQIVGLDLPAGIEYKDLDPDEEETQKPAPVVVSNMAENTAQATEAQSAQTADEDEEDVEDESEAKSLTFDAWQELDIWKRKATKAAKRGEALPIDFVCNHIPVEVAGGIRAALVLGEVKGAFDNWISVEHNDENAQPETQEVKAEGYKPPQAVQAAARRGLELRKKYGKGGLDTQEAGEQGIGSGVARASNLSNGDSVSLDTIRRMSAFFSRHEKNKAGGEDDAGYIAWQLWGGDAGRRWAEGILKDMESKSEGGFVIPSELSGIVQELIDNGGQISKSVRYQLIDTGNEIQNLAAAINAATAAALQPAPEVKAAPMPQPVINVTMPAITLTAQMPAQDAPSVTVNIPEQPAPVVNVTNEVQTPVVNNVVNVPPRPPVTAELTVDPRTGKKVLKAK